jgi:hypothetical protein
MLGLDVDKSAMWGHISNLIGDPIGQKETVFWQHTFRYLDQLHAKISACASCCKRLLSLDDQEGIVEVNINAFPLTFHLANMQIQQLTSLPCDTFENLVHVVQHSNFYHLNLNLVFGMSKIICVLSA